MTPKLITIHCSDTPNGKKFDISVIESWHKSRGFKSIGYHLVIQPDGEVQKGRGLNEVGAHVLNHNEGNIGICLVGRDKFTKQQFESLRYYIHAMQQTYDIKVQDIYCHYEFDTAQSQGKTCPSMRSANIVAWYIMDNYDPISDYIYSPVV